MSKSPDAFRTISEVADWLDTPAHVLRFWESKFSQVKPIKRAGGRRYYRPADMQLLGGIKRLLHHDGLTIKEVQSLLRDKGAKHVGSLSTFDVDSDIEATTVEDTTEIEVDATPSDEPVFTSVAARAEPKSDVDDDQDSNQMSFPGFEFASDRTKMFERAKPVETTQTVDISHISPVDTASISVSSAGILGKIAKLSKDDLTGNASKIASLKTELMNIATARASSSNS